jgi:DNA-binding beta-propeller fold protein YncE
MWGAFGNKPTGPYRCPTTDFDKSVIGTEGPGPKGFDVVHGLRISRDGLVYVADRNYRRVQVFTPDGKYVNQVFIDRNNDGLAGSITFSADPEQRFLYVSSAQIVVINRKTLEMVGRVPFTAVTAWPPIQRATCTRARGGGPQSGHVEKLMLRGMTRTAR